MHIIISLALFINVAFAVLIPIRWTSDDEVVPVTDVHHLRLAFDLIKAQSWPSCQPEQCQQFISGNIEDDEHQLVLTVKKLTGDEKIDMIWLPNTIWDLFVLSRIGQYPFVPDEINLEEKRYREFVEYVKATFGQELLIQLRFLGQFDAPSTTSFAVPAFLSISEILMPKLYNQPLFDQEQTDMLAKELEALNLCHQNDETWCSSLVLSTISSEVKARADNKFVLFGFYDRDRDAHSKYLYHSIFTGFMGRDNSYFRAAWFCVLSGSCKHNSVALTVSPQWILGEGSQEILTIPSVNFYDTVAQESVTPNPSLSACDSAIGKAKLAILLAESMNLLSNSRSFVLPKTESMENIRRQIITKNFVIGELPEQLPSEVMIRSSRNNSKLRLILENGKFTIPKVSSVDGSSASNIQTIDSFLSGDNQ